jgi:hypothetical protein
MQDGSLPFERLGTLGDDLETGLVARTPFRQLAVHPLPGGDTVTRIRCADVVDPCMFRRITLRRIRYGGIDDLLFDVRVGLENTTAGSERDNPDDQPHRSTPQGVRILHRSLLATGEANSIARTLI